MIFYTQPQGLPSMNNTKPLIKIPERKEQEQNTQDIRLPTPQDNFPDYKITLEGLVNGLTIIGESK